MRLFLLAALSLWPLSLYADSDSDAKAALALAAARRPVLVPSAPNPDAWMHGKTREDILPHAAVCQCGAVCTCSPQTLGCGDSSCPNGSVLKATAPKLVQERVQHACQCQTQGESACLCLKSGQVCQCTPTLPTMFMSDRYYWRVYRDGDSSGMVLIDGATDRQVGAWTFASKTFRPLIGGDQWGEPCDPPIPPPAAPAKRVGVNMLSAPVFAARSMGTFCAGST